MENIEILRKLDHKETSLIERGTGQNVLVNLRIQSSMDIFAAENIIKFKRAILIWKRTHKFLSSEILKTNDHDFYFEYIDDHDAWYSFDNVKFLRLQNHYRASSTTTDVLELISSYLFEHSIADEINPEKNSHRLLWNIYLFELDRVNHVYDMIVKFHHTIAQGYATIKCLFALLQIFEDIYKNEPVETEYENGIFPGCECLFGGKKPLTNGIKTYHLRIPSFINRIRARESALSVSPPANLNMNAMIVNADSGALFETMQSLFEISRHNHIKYKLFNLEASLFSKLVARCRVQGAKVNGCLEILICWAFLQWYRKHAGPDDELEQICYFIVVDLRKYIQHDQIDESTLGFCTGGLLAYPDMNELDRIGWDPVNVNKYFWPLVRKTSDELHERLRSDDVKFFPKVFGPERDDLYYHFFISNIGIPPNTDRFDLIKIKSENCFGISTFGEARTKRLFQFYALMGTDSELKYLINYNSHFIDTFLIEDFMNTFNNIVHHVLKYT